MAADALLACIFLGLAHETSSVALPQHSKRLESGAWCPQVCEIVEHMQAHPSDPAVLAQDCSSLSGCVSSASKEDQDQAAAAGVLEAAIGAQRSFPQDKQVQIRCTQAASQPILFNRGNGLRAGKLGGLNLTLAAYRSWMDDPKVTSLGGAIGSYFDYVNENRAIARELGGIQLIIQNIRNNFHGKYGDWAYEPVKNSLFALSSGCWKNQDICHQEGFVDLAISLMLEHTNETKIAEETLQAVKALINFSEDYRQEIVAKGGARALVAVLAGNQGDRGALSLTCEMMAALVGPAMMGGPFAAFRLIKFDPHIQEQLAQAGAVEALLDTIMGRKRRQHFDNGGFNFDVDVAYNSDAQCIEAAQKMASEETGSANADAMLRAGLATDLAGKMDRNELNQIARGQGCALLTLLAERDPSVERCLTRTNKEKPRRLV